MPKSRFQDSKLIRLLSIPISIVGVILVFIAIIVAWNLVLGKGNNNQNNNTSKTEEIKAVCFRRKIDGVCLDSKEKTNLYPVAIMVENMYEAWPLSGIDKANLVIEAPVEGGIPRLLAVYASDENIPQIGPVRSARPYYLDWSEEFSALYLHVGGSPEALAKINTYNIFDLNQFFNDQYFWRDKKRSMPHNVYTSSDLIAKALTAKDLTEVGYESWLYKDEAKLESRPTEVKDITIGFQDPIYLAIWKYNKETNDYTRYEGKKQQKIDAVEIRAKNIAVQIANIQILDTIGRRRIVTISEGQAMVFRDGVAIEGKWKKPSRGARTKFFDSNGKEIEFNGGTTWIEVAGDVKLIGY